MSWGHTYAYACTRFDFVIKLWGLVYLKLYPIFLIFDDKMEKTIPLQVDETTFSFMRAVQMQCI